MYAWLFLSLFNSLRNASQELLGNKLRSFLSLLGITFGVFCIIAVLATIRSMQDAVANELKAIGNHIVFIQKYPAGGGDDYPWWSYIKRPEAKYGEMKLLEKKMPQIKNMACLMYLNGSLDFGGNVISSGINYYGITEKFNLIESVSLNEGRYFQIENFENGSNCMIIGHYLAEELFTNAEMALNKKVRLANGKSCIIIGVLEKQGQSIMNAFDYDHSILLPYKFMQQIIKEENAAPVIMVQGDDNIPISALKDEAAGAMRSIRKLGPRRVDNFALNDVEGYAKYLDSIFYQVKIGGWAIAGLSLLVGMFGVSNIMFVSVSQRTSQIGLKKSLGAKKREILIEFLIESIMLCFFGGFIGVSLVYFLGKALSGFIGFAVYIPFDVISLALVICVSIGILSGINPAIKAAKMDPIIALRSGYL